MGGVLQYKWEAYCGVSLSSKPRSQESTAIQTGGVLPYKLEVYCRTFQKSCRGRGFRNIAQKQEELEEVRGGGGSRGESDLVTRSVLCVRYSPCMVTYSQKASPFN